jgi:hypothetical protein
MNRRMDMKSGSKSSHTKLDFFIYGLIVVFCYFSFQQSDILHTGGSSLTALEGHIFDFYEVNKVIFGGNNYLPSSYILFALWNIPLKLFGIIKEPSMNVGNVVFWYKLLPTIFYFSTAIIIYRIGLIMNLNKAKSILMSCVWISTPIAVFSQFIFGQYDIFTVFFTMMGLLFFLKRRQGYFVLFFGIAITFKYFPLFIFIPLLLLTEKKLKSLIIKGALFLLPIAFQILLFIDSPDFRAGVFGFGANQRMFTAGLHLESNITISFFLIIWAIICAFAYFKQIVNQEELIIWSLYLSMAISSLMFSLILWHPQWLLFATPFLVLTTFINKRSQFFLFLDILMMFFFIGFTVNFWANHVDQALWGLGIFKNINATLASPDALMMRSFFIPNDISIYYSLIASCFVIHIIFKFPREKIYNISSDIKENINLVRLRFIIGIMIFVIPATICLFYPNSGLEQYNVISKPNESPTPTQELINGLEIGQVFSAKGENIKKIKVQIGTHIRTNTSTLYFYVAEASSGNILHKQEIKTNELVDNAYLDIKFSEPIMTKSGMKYKFYFNSTNAKQGNAISIWHTSEGTATNEEYAVINNQPQNFNLHFSMYGN